MNARNTCFNFFSNWAQKKTHTNAHTHSRDFKLDFVLLSLSIDNNDFILRKVFLWSTKYNVCVCCCNYLEFFQRSQRNEIFMFDLCELIVNQ